MGIVEQRPSPTEEHNLMEFVTRDRKAKGKQSGQHNRYVEVLDP